MIAGYQCNVHPSRPHNPAFIKMKNIKKIAGEIQLSV